MVDITSAIITLTGLVCVVLVSIFFLSFQTAGESIFKGSGDPQSMGKILIRALRTSTEVIFGLFAVTVIVLLIANNLLNSDVGMPVIASIISYILGKGFKDISFGEEK